MRIDHINRYVSSVEAMVSFYTDALEFILLDQGVKANGQNYAILRNGGIELFLSEKDGFAFDTDANFRHMGFSVDNADELLYALKAKGYIPKEEKIIVKAFSRQFYMKDPDGFEIDFIQWTNKERFYRHLEDKQSENRN